MQFTKREQSLVLLLRTGPRTGAELADALDVSRRTITREISAINRKLNETGAGSIVSESSYRLQVLSEEALRALLEDGIPDEASVLLSVLTSPEASLASVVQETYLSRRALAGVISSINREYGDVVHLEPRAGRGIEVSLVAAQPADVLASLATDTPMLVRRMEELGDWARVDGRLGDAVKTYLADMAPYLSVRQAHLQAVAAAATAPMVRGAGSLSCSGRAEAVREFFRGKRELLVGLMRHRAQLMDEISELLGTYGIRSARSDLRALIFDHVVRCALFPSLMSREMRTQMRDMRLRHPFEFDFGDDLSARLRMRQPRVLVEPEFLALYVLASAEEQHSERVSVLVLCHRRSMSAINQRLIEQNVRNVEVFVVSDETAFDLVLSREWDLLVRDEDGPECPGIPRWDMVFRGVLGTSELRRIRRLALGALYCKNLARMFARENYLELHNEGGPTEYLAALEEALRLFVEEGRLSEGEAALVLARERAGERLSMGGIAFPHAITPVVSSTFRVLVVMPARALEDNGESIGLVVIVLASQAQTDKSSIFAYFLSVIESARADGIPLPNDYEGTLCYLGPDARDGLS